MARAQHVNKLAGRHASRAAWPVVAVWLAFSLVAAPVLGADASTEARANAIYKDAKERFENGDLPKALALVTQAEGLFNHPAIIFLRGRVLHKMARLREADEALRLADTALLPKPLQKPLEDERLAVTLEMHTKGELLLTVDPDSAGVTIDGEEIRLDSVGWLSPGKHKIEATAPGYQTMTREVQIPTGESATATLRLVPIAGSLVIIVPGSLRDAEVRLDGLLVELKAGEKLGDRTPPMHVQAGPHRVVCSRGDSESAHDVEVSASGVTEVTCSDIAPATGTARKVLGWSGVAAGAGLVGVGTWSILSFLLVDTKDPRYNDPRYQVSHNKVIYGSTYAALGVAVGVCSWLFLLRDGKSAETRQN
jgi:hypothetical protein